MSSFSTGLTLLHRNKQDFLRAVWDTLSPIILSDYLFLKVKFRLMMGYWPNLKNPETFNEKIQWLRLYGYRPIYTMMVDKIAVKEYVKDIIGEEHIIPTLCVWNSFDEINFDALPNQFVLKCNHDSASVIVCKDKSSFDREAAKQKLEFCLKRNYYWSGRDKPYKYVKPKIFAEKYIDMADSEELVDYKFYCFDGVPQYCQVITGRNSKMTIDFFDLNWKHLPFLKSGKPFSADHLERPKHFEEMIELSRRLSIGLPFIRVDLYDIGKQILFGELTFYPNGGWGKFSPHDWDYKLGEMIKLPNKK